MIRHSLLTRIRLELLRRVKYRAFMASGRRQAHSLLAELPRDTNAAVVVIAFNEARLISVQLELLRKHCKTEFEYIVVDNSSDAKRSDEVRHAVHGGNAHYVRLPKNWFSNSRGAAKPGRGSLSHSVALDWVWKKILTPLSPKIAVLLDHDVFPLRDFNFDDVLADCVAVGAPRFGAHRWTLWPGLSVFRFRSIAERKITFMPSGDLDSGAGLWASLISTLDPSSTRQMSRHFFHLAEGSHPAKDDLEEIDDTWLHLGDGSGWFDGVSKADALIAHSHENPEITPEITAITQLLKNHNT
jgi:hypothetical protein